VTAVIFLIRALIKKIKAHRQQQQQP